MFDTGLGSEIPIDKIVGSRSDEAIGRLAVAPPVLYACDGVEVGFEVQQLVFKIGGCPEEGTIQALSADGTDQPLHKRDGRKERRARS